ncbi:MAG: nickel-dependent lactate racemase family protein [Candidatus Dormibacteraceae bacterium]
MSTATESVNVPYGSQVVSLKIPSGCLRDNLGMKAARIAPNPTKAVDRALDDPIGSDRLEHIVRPGQKVTIVVDDLTRPTPVHLLLPAVLERLSQAGLPSAGITILVATGTHRPMTVDELRARLGDAAIDGYRVVNHDYRRTGDLVELGNTPSGIPIKLNRLVVEADLVVGIGNIVPHRYCGWAGGAKIIQPGVSGESTTAATHLMITKDPDIRLGVVENRVRHEIETVAEKVRLRFIVNTILDPQGRLVDVVAGDFRRAFREGVKRALKVYSCTLTARADIVIASSHPADLNLWQAGKGLYAADLAINDGGIVILASPCYEGVGEHGEFVECLRYDYAELDRLISEERVRDRIGAAAALAVAVITARAEVWLVAQTISDAEATRMRMRRFDHLQVALDAALRVKPSGSTVTVLREAAEILPVLSA